MAFNIRSARGRALLAVRAEPYWETLLPGLGLGVYVGKAGQAWKARRTDPACVKKWVMTTLGPVKDMDFTEAREKAEAWAKGVVVDQKIAKAPTVADATSAWLGKKGTDSGNTASPQTRLNWESYARRIEKHFGARTRIAAVTKAQVTKWRDRAASASAGDRDLAQLKAVMNAGAEALGYDGPRTWNEVGKHGRAKAAIEAADKGIGEGRAFSLAELQRIVDSARADDPDFGDFVAAMAMTLQRPEALRMLEVRDFDPERGRLRFRRGKNTAKRGVIEVDLFDNAVALFKRRAEGRRPNDPLLGTGTDAWPQGFQRSRFPRAVRAAGISDAGATFYTIRHSAITWAVSDAKLDPMSVAQMADTSVDLILKHYFRRTERLGAGPAL